jgi:hypothetical protein
MSRVRALQLRVMRRPDLRWLVLGWFAAIRSDRARLFALLAFLALIVLGAVFVRAAAP